MLKSGHKIVPLVGKEQDKLVEDFKTCSLGTIRLQPGGWFFLLPFIDFADKFFEYKFRPSDTIVMTYPKCGTTWTQEIVWTMMNNPDLNNPLGETPINIRVPFIDMDSLINVIPRRVGPGDDIFDIFTKRCPGKKIEDCPFLQLLDTTPDPRVIKTHLPFSLLMPNLLDTCKVIYVARDPKDVAVSYHHHCRVLKSFEFVGNMDDFVDHFINDELIWSPFWTHIEEAWKQRGHKNLHFIFYEDMHKNTRAEVVRLQNFLDMKLTDEQIDNIVAYTSFSEMKKRDNAFGKVSSKKNKENPFVNIEIATEEGGAMFRKGITGDWKNKLTAEQVQKIEDWTKKNTKSFGPDFKYESKAENNDNGISQANDMFIRCIDISS